MGRHLRRAAPPLDRRAAPRRPDPEEEAYAIDTDRLDQKWGVDGKKLRTRLNRASYGERMAIAEMTMAFYRRLEEGETAGVIGKIVAPFQPQSPDRVIPAHTRMSPAMLLGEDAAVETTATGNADQDASAVTEAPPRPDTETGPDTDNGDGADDGDKPQTETRPAGPPQGPRTPAAPPTGPESSAPEMALDTGDAHSADSADPAAEDAESAMPADGDDAEDAETGGDAETVNIPEDVSQVSQVSQVSRFAESAPDAENASDSQNATDAENATDAQNASDVQDATGTQDTDETEVTAPAPDGAAAPEAGEAPADGNQDQDAAAAAALGAQVPSSGPQPRRRPPFRPENTLTRTPGQQHQDVPPRSSGHRRKRKRSPEDIQEPPAPQPWASPVPVNTRPPT